MRQNRQKQRDKNTRRNARERVTDRYWIYGRHATAAALKNSNRKVYRVLATREHLNKNLPSFTEIVSHVNIASFLDAGSVHQGIAILVSRLPSEITEEACKIRDGKNLVLVLDQISDPQNVGAILRTAEAFGANALLVPNRHTAQETGALAKAASGALENIPIVRTNNLSGALLKLAEIGYWRYGLVGSATTRLDHLELPINLALVLGAEGKGIRRLTARRCDELVRIPIQNGSDSLNVSAAAAVAMYIAHHGVIKPK